MMVMTLESGLELLANGSDGTAAQEFSPLHTLPRPYSAAADTHMQPRDLAATVDAMTVAVVDGRRKVNVLSDDYAGDNVPRYVAEAREFSSRFHDYFSSPEGKLLLSLFADRGYTPDIRGVGAASLGEYADAAMISLPGGAQVIAGNAYGSSFSARLDGIAARFGVIPDMAFAFLVAHEMLHSAGIHNEAPVSEVMRDAFAEMSEGYALQGDFAKAGQYQRLSQLAEAYRKGIEHLGQEEYEELVHHSLEGDVAATAASLAADAEQPHEQYHSCENVAQDGEATRESDAASSAQE
jgi:hypothetical protein